MCGLIFLRARVQPILPPMCTRPLAWSRVALVGGMEEVVPCRRQGKKAARILVKAGDVSGCVRLAKAVMQRLWRLPGDQLHVL